MICANGKASSDMYFETLSEIPAQRSASAGAIGAGLGPEAQVHTATAKAHTTRELFKGSRPPRGNRHEVPSGGLYRGRLGAISGHQFEKMSDRPSLDLVNSVDMNVL
ncbi:MAG: hypothetical protein NVSMB53_07910 [Gemmatimonadaceae bacterium]